MKKSNFSIFTLIKLFICIGLIITTHQVEGQTLNINPEIFPTNGAQQVNPDTYFQLTFNAPPHLFNKGKIRIFDASNDTLVDELDLAIAPGPKNTRTPAPYDKFIYNHLPDSLYVVNKTDSDPSHIYQTNYIGGKQPLDAHHFYPVLIEGNSAKIFPHNNRLTYNKTYYILIDSGVFTNNDNQKFAIHHKNEWRFKTKLNSPSKNAKNLKIAADGSGDFTTVQGAIDFIPENDHPQITLSIKKGIYNEIINCQYRKGISFIGENRNSVVIRYPNNGVFNMRDISPDPKLNGGTHHIRAVMSITHSSEISIENLTVQSVGEKPAQAEALLLVGDKVMVKNVVVDGSGDALQATGRIYLENCRIQGIGDNVLGYGAVFFKNCEFVSTGGPHMWVRNTDKNHGNVLVNCVLRTTGNKETEIARAPDNRGVKYPYAEAVLIDCKVENVSAIGWGKVTDATENIRYWEYNTTDLTTGKPVDVSQRHPSSKQLTLEKDAKLIKDYRNPAFVLNGWNPTISGN